MAKETEVTTIPQLRQVYYDLYANFPAANAVQAGDLAYATDTLILYRSNGAAWQVIARPVDYPAKVEPNFVRWVLPGWNIYAQATIAVTAGVIYYTPIFVEKDTTYIRIAIEVTAFVAGNADLRIFNFENGLPTSEVLSAGTVDTGTNGLKEIVIAQALTRGYYFLAARFSATPTVRGISPGDPITIPFAGFAQSQNFAQLSHVLIVTAAWADPAPAPTGALDLRYANILLREN